MNSKHKAMIGKKYGKRTVSDLTQALAQVGVTTSDAVEAISRLTRVLNGEQYVTIFTPSCMQKAQLCTFCGRTELTYQLHDRQVWCNACGYAGPEGDPQLTGWNTALRWEDFNG